MPIHNQFLRIVCFVSIFVGLSITSISTADDDPLTPWPVEQHCITEAPRPTDWSYPGTILMGSSVGIHGMQDGWDTPHIFAFLNRTVGDDELFTGSGQLSPDGYWYFVPYGEIFTEISNTRYWSVRFLRLFHLTDGSPIQDFDVREFGQQGLSVHTSAAWTAARVAWGEDSQVVMVGDTLLNPFTGVAETSNYGLFAPVQANIFVSPDLTRVYRINSSGLFDVDAGEFVDATLDSVFGMFWQRDSSGFMAVSQMWHDLNYYDRNGENAEHIWHDEEQAIVYQPGIAGRNDLSWSPDGERFTFIARSNDVNRLYVVDRQAEVVIDTCLSPRSMPVWSPDGQMLAYIGDYNGVNFDVWVFDWQAQETYLVAYNRGAQMVGWRD